MCSWLAFPFAYMYRYVNIDFEQLKKVTLFGFASLTCLVSKQQYSLWWLKERDLSFDFSVSSVCKKP